MTPVSKHIEMGESMERTENSTGIQNWGLSVLSLIDFSCG